MSEQVVEPHEIQLALVKEIGKDILGLEDQIEAKKARAQAMPRKMLVEAAWQGIAHYHREGTIWGFDRPEIQAFEREKNLRLSFLTDEEREQAINMANNWLDDNFGK